MWPEAPEPRRGVSMWPGVPEPEQALLRNWSACRSMFGRVSMWPGTPEAGQVLLRALGSVGWLGLLIGWPLQESWTDPVLRS